MADLDKMIQARDQVDDMFLEFATPGKMSGNYESLSHLALIGGRLDTLIRRERAARRKPPRFPKGA